MSEPQDNGDRKLMSIVGLIAWRWGMAIAAALAAYGAMWVKLNAPSRVQFDMLTAQVQGMRDELMRISDYRERINDFEQRLRQLEGRRPPARSPANTP